MSEIAKFAHHGAASVTTEVIKNIHKKLPFLKVEFAQINAPKFPHLVDQLEFLAAVVEDFAEGAADEMPLVSVAGAVFGLIYAHRQIDLIPDSNVEYGHADDSAVVRAILMDNEKVFAAFATKHGMNWSKITVKP